MNQPVQAEPYQHRRTWPIGVHDIGNWQLKVYGICASGCELTTPTIEAAMEYARKHVRWPDRDPGCGFLTLHVGEESVWLLVDLWVDDILRHFLYQAPLDQPDQFGPGPGDGTMACVWELAVLAGERTAWIEHVLSRPDDPDYPGYLADSLEIAGGAIHSKR